MYGTEDEAGMGETVVVRTTTTVLCDAGDVEDPVLAAVLGDVDGEELTVLERVEGETVAAFELMTEVVMVDMETTLLVKVARVEVGKAKQAHSQAEIELHP